MNRMKGLLFGIGGLFLVVTLLSLLMPSKVMTARSVVIHASDTSLEKQIADLANWKNWHPVFMNKVSHPAISNPSSGIGASAKWTTNGKENILQITERQPGSVRMRLARSGENEIDNILSLSHVEGGSAVQVEWRVLTRLEWYPWEKFYGIFVDKLTGPGYEQALDNLKKFAEN